LVAAAMILNSTQPGLEITVNLFGLEKLSLTTLLGLTGYSLATVLGLWLIISILRSGRL
jgi:ubiquinone biosynthesis protein